MEKSLIIVLSIILVISLVFGTNFMGATTLVGSWLNKVSEKFQVVSGVPDNRAFQQASTIYLEEGVLGTFKDEQLHQTFDIANIVKSYYTAYNVWTRTSDLEFLEISIYVSPLFFRGELIGLKQSLSPVSNNDFLTSGKHIDYMEHMILLRYNIVASYNNEPVSLTGYLMVGFVNPCKELGNNVLTPFVFEVDYVSSQCVVCPNAKYSTLRDIFNSYLHNDFSTHDKLNQWFPLNYNNPFRIYGNEVSSGFAFRDLKQTDVPIDKYFYDFYNWTK